MINKLVNTVILKWEGFKWNQTLRRMLNLAVCVEKIVGCFSAFNYFINLTSTNRQLFYLENSNISVVGGSLGRNVRLEIDDFYARISRINGQS